MSVCSHSGGGTYPGQVQMGGGGVPVNTMLLSGLHWHSRCGICILVLSKVACGLQGVSVAKGTKLVRIQSVIGYFNKLFVCGNGYLI